MERASRPEKARRNVEAVRLSRFLAGAGVSSRRHADELISEGRVKVNGKVAKVGDKVIPGVDRVWVDGREVGSKEEPVYIMLNKPPGCLSTCDDPFDRKTVLALVSEIPARIFPVGRLDLDADGLLLLTNDGELTNLLTHPKHRVVKEYLVLVSGEGAEDKIGRIVSGMIVDGRRVDVDYVRLVKDRGRPLGKEAAKGQPRLSKVVIGVHEGEKHLVKNICRAVGLRVRRLTRVRLGPIRLGNLPQGKWRRLEDGEVTALYADACRVWEGEHHG